MKKILLITSIIFVSCFTDSKKDEFPQISAGIYTRIESNTLFSFNFQAGGNLTVQIYESSILLETINGTWSQNQDNLCMNTNIVNGCDKIRSVTITSFELFDGESNSWIIFSK